MILERQRRLNRVLTLANVSKQLAVNEGNTWAEELGDQANDTSSVTHVNKIFVFDEFSFSCDLSFQYIHIDKSVVVVICLFRQNNTDATLARERSGPIVNPEV